MPTTETDPNRPPPPRPKAIRAQGEDPQPGDLPEKVARPEEAEALRRRLAVTRAYLGIIG